VLQLPHHLPPPQRIVSQRRNHSSQKPSTDFCNKICHIQTSREFSFSRRDIRASGLPTLSHNFNLASRYTLDEIGIGSTGLKRASKSSVKEGRSRLNSSGDHVPGVFYDWRSVSELLRPRHLAEADIKKSPQSECSPWRPEYPSAPTAVFKSAYRFPPVNVGGRTVATGRQLGKRSRAVSGRIASTAPA
jgi:hypothetical protein